MLLRGGTVDHTVLGAQVVGWCITGAAITLYVPMIAELVRNQKAPASMSATTWSLQLLGFTTTVIYHVRMGYPLSTFADFAALGVQSLVILTLCMHFRKRVTPFAILPLFGLIYGLLAGPSGLRSLQVVSAAVTTWALLPQIVRNVQAKSRGGFSPSAAALSCVGNAGRLFTTLKLADANLILIGQFGVTLVLNSVLLVQSLVWD